MCRWKLVLVRQRKDRVPFRPPLSTYKKIEKSSRRRLRVRTRLESAQEAKRYNGKKFSENKLLQSAVPDADVGDDAGRQASASNTEKHVQCVSASDQIEERNGTHK